MLSSSPHAPARSDRAYDIAAILVLLATSAVMLWTWRDYGISWDERFHLEYGDHILAWYSSGFEDKTALSYRIDYLYGGGFDLAGAAFRKLVSPPLDRFDGIHLFGTLVGIAGFWGTWKLGRVLGGPRAGLLAAGFIAATSVYWGHVANNPKDLPFAVGYVWAMAYLIEAIRAFPRLDRALAIKLAIAIGLAMSVRIAGMLLLCYLALAIGLWVAFHGLVRRDVEAAWRYGRRLGLTGIGVAAGAWIVMLIWWPWAVYDPIKRPIAALRRMSQFMGHKRDMPFAGETISTFDVDWRYMPHYFGLKLPEFVVVLALAGALVGLLALAWRARAAEAFTDNLVLAIVLVSVLFPWAYAVYKHSVLYDGLRHFLFEVPVVVAGAAWFGEQILAQLERLHWSAAVLGGLGLAGLCVDQYATMARLHPHQYVYFNRFIGGLEGAVGNYDTDYYAVTYADAGEQFARHLWQTEDHDAFLNTVYRIGGCGGELRTLRQMPPNFSFARRNFDFWAGYTRNDCHERHAEGPVVFELTREGGVLVVVRDLRQVRAGDAAKRAERVRQARARARARRRAAEAKSNSNSKPDGEAEPDAPSNKPRSTPRPRPKLEPKLNLGGGAR